MTFGIKDLCKRLAVGEHTVLGWIRRGELRAIDVSRTRGRKPRWRIADLGRLSIVEKSYGYRLEAIHDESGHADLATALAIALPLAVERIGEPRILVGAINSDSQFEALALEARQAWTAMIIEQTRHFNE